MTDELEEQLQPLLQYGGWSRETSLSLLDFLYALITIIENNQFTDLSSEALNDDVPF